jgi:hypothetical protein
MEIITLAQSSYWIKRDGSVYNDYGEKENITPVFKVVTGKD